MLSLTNKPTASEGCSPHVGFVHPLLLQRLSTLARPEYRMHKHATIVRSMALLAQAANVGWSMAQSDSDPAVKVSLSRNRRLLRVTTTRGTTTYPIAEAMVMFNQLLELGPQLEQAMLEVESEEPRVFLGIDVAKLIA